ncbi:MAG: hypothetical protein A3G75_00885 [Verrucomicrobia bacterium RIFCSPLOWO2_12_FULL_64_8]|nr:MAG: hypothetical protein A3G75_00885 [Verrucomicrobia bacterium RIFCSPLOWO2_12_FULL_64_8]
MDLRLVQICLVKNIELSDEAYAALKNLADAKGSTPAGIITSLLNLSRPPLAGDALLFYLASPEFAAIADQTDRYLALLAWVARTHALDFADFIAHQESDRRYLALGRDQIREIMQRNHARQIPGTQYWAVMNIDATTKRRFVCRLLEFIGCHDETVVLARHALGFNAVGAARHRQVA